MATIVHFIGRNTYGEFGGGNEKKQDEICESAINDISRNIKQIVSGNDFSFYCDDEQNIWFSGYHGGVQSCIEDMDDESTINEFRRVDFFMNRGIKIKAIRNNVGLGTFWITESNQVYASGYDPNFKFGLAHSNASAIPTLIPNLSNVIDIQPAGSYSIALCSNQSSNTMIIIKFWCRNNHIDAPEDIMNIIIAFYTINAVYSTGQAFNFGHGHYDKETAAVETWTEIDGLKDKHIIKIRVGTGHSLFLEANGTVWGCGGNRHGQLGLGHFEQVKEITKIDFFVQKGIKIKEIECGWNFNIMLDTDDRVWIFGENSYGQIGDGLEEHVSTPKELVMFRDRKVDVIKCGLAHVYLRCDNNRHLM